MKKTTLLGIALLISYIGQSQDTRLEKLLAEYQNLPSSSYSLKHYFDDEEIAILQNHFLQQNETEKSRASVANDATIFGANFGSNTLVSVNTATPGILTGINASLILPNDDFESSGDIDPINLNEAYVITFLGRFFRLDITTGVYTSLGTISPPENEVWAGLEFDPSTNILYGISGTFSDPRVSTLSTINIEELSFTAIGNTELIRPTAIVTDGDGNFYAQDSTTDSLWSINPNTAEATFIGLLGFDSDRGQDMEWDAATGVLYMVAFSRMTNKVVLRTVDTSTGLSTLIGAIGDEPGDHITWCAIQNSSTLSVNDNNVTQVSISPNPTKDLLNINAKAPIKQITIYNSLGQNVTTYTANNLQTYTINTSGMDNGLYVIELTTPLGTVTENFIKQYYSSVYKTQLEAI